MHFYTVSLMFQPNIPDLTKGVLANSHSSSELRWTFQLTNGALLVALAGFQQGLFPSPPVCSDAVWFPPRGGLWVTIVAGRARISLSLNSSAGLSWNEERSFVHNNVMFFSQFS